MVLLHCSVNTSRIEADYRLNTQWRHQLVNACFISNVYSSTGLSISKNFVNNFLKTLVKVLLPLLN